MKFKKFSSIENLQRADKVQTMQVLNPSAFSLEWCVTEKIHGSSYALYFNGLEHKSASRTRFLPDHENFFNHKKVYTELRPKVERLYELCREEGLAPENAVLCLYGEIFGGWYPSPHVPPIKGVKRVQKGVYYHPDNQFLTFSMVIRDEDCSIWVPLSTRLDLLARSGIGHVPVFMRGSFADCCKYPNEFQTVVSATYGLPPIGNNTCEGVVLEPCVPAFLPDGSRIVLKNKNAKFTEKAKEPKKVRLPKEFPEKLGKHCEDMSKYVTENRLRNVISKIGSVGEKDFGNVIRPFSEDIWEDFIKDFPEAMHLEKADRKVVTKAMNRLAANLIRKNFYKIVAGDF